MKMMSIATELQIFCADGSRAEQPPRGQLAGELRQSRGNRDAHERSSLPKSGGMARSTCPVHRRAGDRLASRKGGVQAVGVNAIDNVRARKHVKQSTVSRNGFSWQRRCWRL